MSAVRTGVRENPVAEDERVADDDLRRRSHKAPPRSGPAKLLRVGRMSGRAHIESGGDRTVLSKVPDDLALGPEGVTPGSGASSR